MRRHPLRRRTSLRWAPSTSPSPDALMVQGSWVGRPGYEVHRGVPGCNQASLSPGHFDGGRVRSAQRVSLRIKDVRQLRGGEAESPLAAGVEISDSPLEYAHSS